MTTNELQTMLETPMEQSPSLGEIDRKIFERIGDPDAGLKLPPEIIASIERQRKAYATSKHGKSLDEVAGQLGPA
jgi:hypothetical protein